MVATELPTITCPYLCHLLSGFTSHHMLDKKKTNMPIYYPSYRQKYSIPLGTVEEAAAYWIVSSSQAFIGYFTYPWKLPLQRNCFAFDTQLL